MHTKVFFLFLLVLFGAYAEFQAGKTIKRLKIRERRPSQLDTVQQSRDTASFEAILSVFQREDSGDTRGLRESVVHEESGFSSGNLWGSLNEDVNVVALSEMITDSNPIDLSFYCISGKEITSFEQVLRAVFILNARSKAQHERVIPEMPIPQLFAQSFFMDRSTA